jgi:hypothetical protein
MIIKIKIKILLLLSTMLLIGPAPALDDDRLNEIASLNVTATVFPYTTVSVSINELSFSILGTPGGYISTDVVVLTVDSNQSTWGVYAKASDLKHDDFGIANLPGDRLAIAVDDSEHFTPLKNNVLFFQGVVDKEPKPVRLRFRLTTTWQDTPGIYKGKVTFAFLNNP